MTAERNVGYISPLTRFKYNCWQVFDHKIGRDKAFKYFLKSRKKLEENILNQVSNGPKGKLIEPDRISNFDPEFILNEYVKKAKPVIIEGVANDWDCTKNWSLEYFKRLHGEDEILLIDNADRRNNKFEKLTLADVIDNINSGGSKYYRFYPLLRRHPEHIKDFDYKWLRSASNPSTKFEVFQVFIGGTDTESDLHSNFGSNFFTQAFGEKHWVMFDLKDTPVIDPFPGKNLYRSANGFLGEPFNCYEPDYKTYPGFEFINRYDFVLKPGDILYIPPFMWHAVKNITPSIGVAYRWLSYATSMKSSSLFFLMDMTKTNPTVWQSLSKHKEDTNLVHLADLGMLDKYIEELENCKS